MSHVNNVGTSGAARPEALRSQAPGRAAGPTGPAPAAKPADTVELSDTARGAAIRTDLVERVKAEIAAGTYLTDDKISAAADTVARALTGDAEG